MQIIPRIEEFHDDLVNILDSRPPEAPITLNRRVLFKVD
jgi:hypothetical protein